MRTDFETTSSMNPSFQRGDLKTAMDAFFDAAKNGRLNDILSFYVDDVVAYDMMAPVHFLDLKQYADIAWKVCSIDAFEFPLEYYKFEADKIIEMEDSALVMGLMHVQGKFKNGPVAEARLRTTMFFQKIDGQWKILHVHNSVPVGTDLQAMMNLRPGSTEEKRAIADLRDEPH